MTSEGVPHPPEVFIIGGPNGSGKTTIATTLLPEHIGVTHFVNADMIARGLSPFDVERVAMQAGRLMVRRMNELRDERASFAFETTLASKSPARFLREAKAMGYRVNLVFVWLRSVEVNVRRVAIRVRRGGHHVPEDVIRRRYRRGIVNFFGLYQPLADEWSVYDNSGNEKIEIAHRRVDEEPMILQPDSWQAFKETHERISATEI